jgi:molybdopterin-guanine dinucleotide biosynthesis protein A
MPAYSGIVLAGGESRRMGRDKAELSLGRETLLERVVAALMPIVDDIVVVGPERKIALPDGATFVQDDIPCAGPLGGLRTGLKRTRHHAALTVACDMPFLDRRLLCLLLDLLEGFDAVVPEVEGRFQPLHAVYSRRIIPTVEQRMVRGQLKLEGLLANLSVRWVGEDEIEPLDPCHRSFVNVNTAADWQAALRLSRAAAGM